MMKFKEFFKLERLVFALVISIFLIGCQNEEGLVEVQELNALVNYEITPITGQYIITLHGESSAKGTKMKYSQMKSVLTNEIVSKFSEVKLIKENVIQIYGFSINGFAVKLDDNQLQLIGKDSRVKLIEQDYLITLGKPSWAGGNEEESPSQETPWGISRVNGGVSNATGTAWVIDSGIDLTHPDLNVDTNRSKSFLGGKDANDPNDYNGHGTHVAGTIAAKDNSEGVIGVAAGATVVSVRVLNRRGSGSYSGVIAGVDYVGAEGQAGDVANMSLGGSVSQTLDDAVVKASNDSGVIFCLAAGNSGDDANNHSPARANGNNIVTVSASDINDRFASFSNYGNPPIDWCAPGVSIKSTWKKGGYNTISGTSMATPHVAGVLLLGSGKVLRTVTGDSDGEPDNIITH